MGGRGGGEDNWKSLQQAVMKKVGEVIWMNFMKQIDVRKKDTWKSRVSWRQVSS